MRIICQNSFGSGRVSYLYTGSSSLKADKDLCFQNFLDSFISHWPFSTNTQPVLFI